MGSGLYPNYSWRSYFDSAGSMEIHSRIRASRVRTISNDGMDRYTRMSPSVSFLERRNAQILAPFKALIRHGTLNLYIVRHPGGRYDYYYLESIHSLLGTLKHILLGLQIPKIPDKFASGYFDMFGEKIYAEKRRSTKPE